MSLWDEVYIRLSIQVKLTCGTTNQLLAASEPNRCEYEYVFQTPAVCEPVSPDKHKDPEHDEL